MRIGIITHNYPAYKEDRQNAGIFVADFREALQKLGHQVYVLCPGPDDKEEGGVTWFNWPGQGKKLGSWKIFSPWDLFSFLMMVIFGFRKAEKFSTDKNLDFAVGMWTVPAGLFALWVNLRLKVPYCLWSLGSDTYIYSRYPLLGWWIKLTLRRANLLLADGIDLARQTAKIAGRPCQFLPSASKMPQRAKITVNKTGPIKLMFLGRMEPVKGPDVLIEAVCKIKDLDFQLHCLGDGSLLPSLKERVSALGLQKKVIFYGNVSDSTVIYQRLLSSDWLVIPSRGDSIPLVFSESMKAHLPVIVAEVGDMVELVKKYQVGFSFPKEDSLKLASILKEVIKKGRAATKPYQQKTKAAAKIFDINTSAKSLLKMLG